jgi:hypothetical protein
MCPEPALAEFGPLAYGEIDAVLFGDYRGWKPLVVGCQLRFGGAVPAGGSEDGVCVFDRWPTRGCVGNGVTGRFAGGGMGH